MPPRRRLRRRTAADIRRSFDPIPTFVPAPRRARAGPPADPMRNIVLDRLARLREMESREPEPGTRAFFEEFGGPVPTSPERAARIAARKIREAERELTEEARLEIKEKAGQKLTEKEEAKLQEARIKEAQKKGEVIGERAMAAEDVKVATDHKTRLIASFVLDFQEFPQLNKVLDTIRQEDFPTLEAYKNALEIEKQRRFGPNGREKSDFDMLMSRVRGVGGTNADLRRAVLFLEKKAEKEQEFERKALTAERKELAKTMLKRIEENRDTAIKDATSQLRINALQFPGADPTTTEDQELFIAQSFGLDPEELRIGVQRLTEEQQIAVVDYFDEVGKRLTKEVESKQLRVEKFEEERVKKAIKQQDLFGTFGTAGTLYTDLVKRKGEADGIDRFNDIAKILGLPQVSGLQTTELEVKDGKTTGIVNVKDVRKLFEIKLPGATSFHSATQGDPTRPQFTDLNSATDSLVVERLGLQGL